MDRTNRKGFGCALGQMCQVTLDTQLSELDQRARYKVFEEPEEPEQLRNNAR